MSCNLYIIQAKPNPAGKADPLINADPSGSEKALSKQERLLCEWVDIENTGDESITFSRIVVLHTLFDDQCYPTGQTETYWSAAGAGIFQPGQVLRIHSGSNQFKHLMTAQDNGGANWHGYAERDDFVMNNRCGDRIIVTWQNASGQSQEDEAFFSPDPPVDAVLQRSNNQLILVNGKIVE